MSPNLPDVVRETHIKSLQRLYSGKVRDIYAVDDDHLLMIATDRVSAYDVILPTPMPGKGRLLTDIALFWFGQMTDLVPNHLTALKLEDILTDQEDYAQAAGRSMIVKRLKPLPIEAVVRGYIIGSGWRDYQAGGAICEIDLPAGLQQADKLPEALFTPATKAAVGDHDENISFSAMEQMIGTSLAGQVRDISQRIYARAAAYALARGIIIADTKFEFGLDNDGRLTLMDEILTPDSSRFWPADRWRPGTSPPSYDKQFVRDYLDTLDWDKTAPGPVLPNVILEKTLMKYREALSRLTGSA